MWSDMVRALTGHPTDYLSQTLNMLQVKPDNFTLPIKYAFMEDFHMAGANVHTFQIHIIHILPS